MKKFFFLLLASSLLTFYSCSKDFLQVEATIERNCTGTYLKVDDVFYYICNQDKVSSYTNGQAISVSYAALEGCKTKPVATCDLNFGHEGIIEIKEILQR